METFRIAEGFRIEIFASEPHVVDPVEMVFDESGGVYVAELLDNPDDPPAGESPLSRIKYLEDTDGDGRIDRHTLFADRLLAVEGIAPWRGGLIATAAPDILYLKDTDGDRRADLREVLYTGFPLAHVEVRISNPRLGLDNWFYVVNRSQPGRITSPRRPHDPPVDIRNREFRFHPLRGLAEPSTGDAQFGQAWNEWGHWFISHNTVHLRHTVIPPGYTERNPLFTVESAAEDISDHGRPAARVFPISEPQQWRIDRTAARQARYDQTQPGRVEQLQGYFSASAGATVYLGDAFPADFAGRVFVGEGAGNLVHCDVLTPSGPTYTAARWPLDADFLASTDRWFRPVNFSNAPDGNLYLLDYYRQYLETPDSIPEAVQRRLNMDFRAGDTLGRIYRVVPDRPLANRPLAVDLGSNSTEELVALLEHTNGWHRRTAHRLLLERQDSSATARLESVARDGRDPNSRLHALWVLEGLGSLGERLVSLALADEHPAVRENAIRLAEAFLPGLGGQILAATRDQNPRVAFQAALTAGNLPKSGHVVSALTGVLSRHPDDPWFRAAVLSAPSRFAFPVLKALTRASGVFESAPDGRERLLGEFARVVAARYRAGELEELLAWVSGGGVPGGPNWTAATLEAMADGLALHRGRRLRSERAVRSLGQLFLHRSSSVRKAAAELAQYFDLGSRLDEMLADAVDVRLPVRKRVLALRALRGGSYEEVSEALSMVLASDPDPELRNEAAISLASFNHPAVGRTLLADWSGYTPTTRDTVADLLTRRRGPALSLADAIVAGRVEPLDIPAVTRIRLANHPDDGVRSRVEGRLALHAGDRDRVVEDHLGVIELPAEPKRGQVAFERECSSCHLRRASRGRIGPDLSGVSNRSRETLLTSILDPNQSIEERYRNHLLETRDGRFHDGILVAETETTLTLRGEATDVTVLKSEIVELRASRVSLMPEGLEDALSDQELADVIAYLRAGL